MYAIFDRHGKAMASSISQQPTGAWFKFLRSRLPPNQNWAERQAEYEAEGYYAAPAEIVEVGDDAA